MKVNIRPDRKLIRAAGGSRRYVLITFTAPTVAPKEGRKPINVSLVLDRSGSMSGEKIELVREAVRKALAMLRPEDRFSLVVYDDKIDARGSTDLARGWLTGCEQIAAHQDPDMLGRAFCLRTAWRM